MGSSVGLGLNETNKRYQDVHAAWNPTPAYPTLTVATSLGGKKCSSHKATDNCNSPRCKPWDHPRSQYFKSFHCHWEQKILPTTEGWWCTMSSPLPQMQYSCLRLSHLITHIGGELNLIRNRQLNWRDTQIMCTKARVKRTRDYTWRCPHKGCCVRMRRDTIWQHCSQSLLHKSKHISRGEC